MNFYKTRAWKDCSRAFMQSKNYVCERCGRPATICHHKKWLNAGNITDPNVTLNWDNLEALCMDCHNKEHFQKNSKAVFDKSGNMTGCRESAGMQDFKKAAKAIDRLFTRLSEPQKE